VYIPLSFEVATKYFPSELEAIEIQNAVPGNPEAKPRVVQFSPEFVLVYIPLSFEAATKYFPSELEVIDRQLAVVGNPDSFLTQVVP
jgi:hypothetical protein